MKKILLATFTCFALGACSDGPHVAKVNGKKIYEDDFNAYLEFKRIGSRTDEQKDKALDQYLQREAMAHVIESELMKGDTLIQAELNELRKEVLISRYFEKYLANQITDEAITNYYNINIEKYEEKKVHVAHILLRTNRNMDESQIQVKRTTMQEAYSKLQAGEDFTEVAKNYSEDAVSSKKGGDLGWLIEGSIHKNFSDAAFSLKADDISEIIETPYGLHVIKVLEAPKVSRKSFENVKGSIRYELRNSAKESERKRLLDMLKIQKG